MISHTYNSATMENLYPRPSFPLCTIQGDYDEKGCASLALSAPKQKLSPCIVAWFLWKHCKIDSRQLGQNWSNNFRKSKRNVLYVGQRKNKTGRAKKSFLNSSSSVSKQGQGLFGHIWRVGWHHQPVERCCLAQHPPFSLSSDDMFGMWWL